MGDASEQPSHCQVMVQVIGTVTVSGPICPDGARVYEQDLRDLE